MSVIPQLYNAYNATDLLTYPFQVFYIPSYINSKDIYNQLITNHIHFVLITKIDIYHNLNLGLVIKARGMERCGLRM